MALSDLLDLIKLDARLIGENYMACCPFAAETHDGGTDSKPSFGVHESTFVYHCFSCHKAGHIEQLVQHMLQITLLESIELVCEYLENYTAFHEAEYYLFGIVPKPPIHIYPEYFNSPFQSGIPRYVINRGINIEIAKEYGLGNDLKNKRLTFPVRNRNNNLVGLIGRSYSPNAYGPKYFNYVEFDKSRVLFGEQMASKYGSSTEPVYIVEGPMDVLKLAQSGFRCAVSIMGSSPSKEQVKRVLAISPFVVSFLDADFAGRNGTKKLAQLCPSRIFTVAHKDGRKDAADYTESELRTLLRPSNFSIIEYENKTYFSRARKYPTPS